MSISEWKEREKAHRRQEIIAIAEGLFISRGYDGVTMEGVAKQAGLAIGTLYIYFKNKESLYGAVVLRGMIVLNDMFKEAVKKGANGAEKLDATGKAFYDNYSKNPEMFRMCVNYSQSFGLTTHNESAIEIMRLGRENFNISCQCIEEGIADGSLRKDLDTVFTALFGIISLQNIIGLAPGFEAIFKATGLSHERFVEYSRDLIARSIIDRPTRDEK